MNDAEACLRAGSSPSYVLLHGFTQTPHSFEPAVVHAPDDGRAIWAIALPGHHPAVPVLDGWAANIKSLARRISARAGIDPDLISYSLGARCALALICDHPTLAASATLIGVHPGLADEAERQQRRQWERRWIELLRQQGIEAFVSEWERMPMWRSQEQVAETKRAAQRTTRLGHDPEGLARSLEHLGLSAIPSYRDRLGQVSIPVSLLTGELDTKFTALARGLGAHRAVPGVGHNVILEAPKAIWGVAC